jgi:flagellar biogenesis protein FliO
VRRGRILGLRMMRLGTELWERVLRLSRRTPKSLRLCESLPLGERRFVAVVEFERARFLVGGTPSSVVLLSRLEDSQRDSQKQVDVADEDGGRSQKC